MMTNGDVEGRPGMAGTAFRATTARVRSRFLQDSPRWECGCRAAASGRRCYDPRCSVEGRLRWAWRQRLLVEHRLRETGGSGRLLVESTLKFEDEGPGEVIRTVSRFRSLVTAANRRGADLKYKAFPCLRGERGSRALPRRGPHVRGTTAHEGGPEALLGGGNRAPIARPRRRHPGCGGLGAVHHAGPPRHLGRARAGPGAPSQRGPDRVRHQVLRRRR
jgi:hypothetical protein